MTSPDAGWGFAYRTEVRRSKLTRKLQSHPAPAPPAPATQEQLRPLLDGMIETFGPSEDSPSVEDAQKTAG